MGFNSGFKGLSALLPVIRVSLAEL